MPQRVGQPSLHAAAGVSAASLQPFNPSFWQSEKQSQDMPMPSPLNCHHVCLHVCVHSCMH